MAGAQIIIFLVIALLVLFGAHWFVYYSLVHFFSIGNPLYKNILFGILIFLAVSFILASLLAHWREGLFTRAFYFASGFWLGLLVNLILAVTAVYIIILLSQIVGFNFSTAVLGSAFLILAFGYSLYGTWNAFSPRVKNITVTIPGLPEQWKDKKIIQLSDVHLGHINRESFMRGVVRKANAENPEMVVITGDLFDGMDGDFNSFVGILNDIQSQKGIFFITGNHETYLGVKKAYAVLQDTKIKVLEDEVVDVGGLRLIGINYPQRGEAKDPVSVLNSLEKDFSGKPNILLYHSPANVEQFKESGVNFQLSGHTHKGQIFPFGYITKLVYKGYDYGLHQIGDFTLYASSGVGTWGPPMRTGNKPEIVVITLQ